MFDFIYDQQDIYNHYDDVFEIRKFGNVILRKNDIPFSNLLGNYYDHILDEFIDENEKQALLNIRWYNFKKYENEFISKKFNPRMYYAEDAKWVPPNNPFQQNPLNSSIGNTSPFSNSFELNQKLIDQFNSNNYFSTKLTGSNNTLLVILNTIIMMVIFYCRLILAHILKYQNMNEAFFLDSLIKYYKSFCECSMYLNDMFENLNVMVNYISETLSKEYPKNPKFSIYRLMLIIWFKEVILPLLDPRSDRNLISCYSKLYRRFFLNEINKFNENDNNINKNFEPSNGLNFNNINQNQIRNSNNIFFTDEAKISSSPRNNEDDVGSDLFSNEDEYNSICPFLDISKISTNKEGNTNISTIPFKPKEKICWQEDVYSFDFQARYFLENINNIFLDQISDEYSAFHINSSKFPICWEYKNLENILSINTDSILKAQMGKINKILLLKHIKDSEFLNLRLINKTKKELIYILTKNIRASTETDLINTFDDFILKNKFSQKDANLFYKIYEPNGEDQNHLYQKFFNHSLKYFEDYRICEYVSILFIKELIKNKNSQYQIIEEFLQYEKEEFERFDFIDREVEKETKRRNILIDENNLIYRQELFHFNTDIPVEKFIEVIQDDYDLELEYNMDNHSGLSLMKDNYDLKNNSDNMNIEIMSTFQQTFDDQNNFQINYDCEMEVMNYDDEFSLRK